MGQAHNLNIKQLTQLARNMNVPDGGFTIKSHGPNTGDSPENAYMVGQSKFGRNKIPMPIDPTDISDFANSRSAELTKDDRYFGGWHNPANEMGALDVSKAYPVSGTMIPPMVDAFLGKEESIGEVGSGGQYVRTIPTQNPADTYYNLVSGDVRSTGERSPDTAMKRLKETKSRLENS